jgi:predicted nucleic acid-binding protein
VRFVDSSFWIALRYRRDQNHRIARALWLDRTYQLITTNHVVGETWTFLRRWVGHVAARGFVDHAERSERLTIVHVDLDIEQVAWDWLRRHDERAYSFVDATSFAVMRRLGMVEALTFDGDFAAAGFVEVRPRA